MAETENLTLHVGVDDEASSKLAEINQKLLDLSLPGPRPPVHRPRSALYNPDHVAALLGLLRILTAGTACP
jgi:hypothetical protein